MANVNPESELIVMIRIVTPHPLGDKSKERWRYWLQVTLAVLGIVATLVIGAA